MSVDGWEEKWPIFGWHSWDWTVVLFKSTQRGHFVAIFIHFFDIAISKFSIQKWWHLNHPPTWLVNCCNFMEKKDYNLISYSFAFMQALQSFHFYLINWSNFVFKFKFYFFAHKIRIHSIIFFQFKNLFFSPKFVWKIQLIQINFSSIFPQFSPKKT